MKVFANPPNTYDIAAKLTDTHGWISYAALFKALRKHWTDDGCCARINEAVRDGMLVEAPATRYRLGVKSGLPDPSPQRTKLEQIGWIKSLLSEFENSERECYCMGSFLKFVDDTYELLASVDEPAPELLN